MFLIKFRQLREWELLKIQFSPKDPSGQIECEIRVCFLLKHIKLKVCMENSREKLFERKFQLH